MSDVLSSWSHITEWSYKLKKLGEFYWEEWKQLCVSSRGPTWVVSGNVYSRVTMWVHHGPDYSQTTELQVQLLRWLWSHEEFLGRRRSVGSGVLVTHMCICCCLAAWSSSANHSLMSSPCSSAGRLSGWACCPILRLGCLQVCLHHNSDVFIFLCWRLWRPTPSVHINFYLT